VPRGARAPPINATQLKTAKWQRFLLSQDIILERSKHELIDTNQCRLAGGLAPSEQAAMLRSWRSNQ
jgi:hypothetical protein